MIITYPKNEFLIQIFPSINLSSDEQIIHEIRKYHSNGIFYPEVTIKDNEILVSIPNELLSEDPKEFNRATNLCAKGQFAQARPILESLIKKHPSVSEYYRNLAQTYEEEDQHEKAIDILIDALRWDPKNHWALILMGNIYARYFDDTDTAMTYYDQVINADPNNFIALNNIGGALVQGGKVDLGEKYLNKAYDINPEYPNTSYALGLIAEMKGDLQKAFKFSIEAISSSESSSNPVFQNALKTAVESARKISNSNSGKDDLVDFISQLEGLTGKEIRIEKDENIPTAAKVEIAENHNRNFHLIKYKDGLGIDHLILHELIHIKFYHEAREINENKLFLVKGEKIREFKKHYSRDIQSLIKKGYPADQVDKVFDQLFEGILRQVFNAPIDLFIEDLIYKKFPTLRPHQFISLYKLGVESLEAVSSKKSVDLVPSELLAQSKVYNVIGARQVDELYGTQFEKQYRISPNEKEQINSLWDEFLEYRKDREPGEEYELIQHWGEDLNLDNYFDLVDENTHLKKIKKGQQSPEDFLSEIEKDPHSLEGYSEEEKSEMENFIAQHSDKDLNMAVVFYMIEAMDYFSKLTKEKIKEIAFEVAMLGQSGIDPKKQGYRLNKIPNKKFSGYNLLAYYYVSWAQAIPEMLSQLQMPFDSEYKMAKSLFKK